MLVLMIMISKIPLRIPVAPKQVGVRGRFNARLPKMACCYRCYVTHKCAVYFQWFNVENTTRIRTYIPTYILTDGVVLCNNYCTYKYIYVLKTII